MSRNKRLQDDISAQSALMSSTRAYVVETFLFGRCPRPAGAVPLDPAGAVPQTPSRLPQFF